MKCSVAILFVGAGLAGRVHAGPITARGSGDSDDTAVAMFCERNGGVLDYDYFDLVANSCKGRSDGKAGEFTGEFKPLEEKEACLNTLDGHSVELSVSNLNKDNSYDLVDKDCVNEFTTLLKSCSQTEPKKFSSHGGWRLNAGWFYSIYPSNSTCLKVTSEELPTS